MTEEKNKIVASQDEIAKMMLGEACINPPGLWVGEFRVSKLKQGIHGYYRNKPVYLSK